MLVLDACPLCRTTLTQGASACPGCGADLAPWSSIASASASYIITAREHLAQGRLEQAEAIISRLGQLSEVDPQLLASLRCRLALACQDSGMARELLPALDPAATTRLLAVTLVQAIVCERAISVSARRRFDQFVRSRAEN